MLPEVLKLAESPLLQGGALSAMLDFFKTIVAAGAPGLGHSDLLALLAHPVLGSKGGSIHKVLRFYYNKLIYIFLQAGRANIAKCVASLVSHSAREAVVVVQQFMASLSATQQDYSLTFSLLAIGEIGRGANLSKLPKLKASLSSPSALMRTTVVTAIKFTISDQLLCTEMHFLKTLNLNIGVRNKLNLIR